MSEDLVIPRGCEEPAEIVLRVARELLGQEPEAGGCITFYHPQEWRRKEEAYGTNSDLVVVHDGGDIAPFFDLNREQYRWIDKMQDALKEKGYYAEQCTCWYSAIYSNPRKPKEHWLRTLPGYFDAVADGSKTFELRWNDRAFEVGDMLLLQEWDGVYTGRELNRKISYILKDVPEYGLECDACVIGMEDIT